MESSAKQISCGTNSIVFFHFAILSPIDKSSIRISPLYGFSNPRTRLSNVDLPEPDAPINNDTVVYGKFKDEIFDGIFF